MLFNALQEGCQSVSISVCFFDTLRIVCNFLSDTQLRRKFQARCLAGKDDCSKFTAFTKTHIDWRWEFLGPALQRVSALMPFVADYFSLETMLSSEQGKSSCGEIRNHHAMVVDCDVFLVYAEIFTVIAAVIEKYASKLEGCLCHDDIWSQKRKFAQRLNEVSRKTGFQHCVPKGRMAAWWIAEGLEACLQELRGATSSKLDRLLQQLPSDKRATAITVLEELRARLVEIVTQKCAFWYKIPWRVIGAFFCCIGGTVARSKEILTECLAEYADTVAGGRQHRLHRVARRLLDPSGIIGGELRDWLVSEKPLREHVHAYCGLLAYGMVSLVERRVESIHARIKRISSLSPNVTQQYMCCRVREEYNLNLLRTNSDFFLMCVKIWRDRLRYTREALRRLSREGACRLQ